MIFKGRYSISEKCRFFGVTRSGYWILRICLKNGCTCMGSSLGRENTGMSGWVRQNILLSQSAYMTWKPRHISQFQNNSVYYSEYNLLSLIRRKKYHNLAEHLHRYPYFLNRDLKAERPKQSGLRIFHIYRLSLDNPASFSPSSVYQRQLWQSSINPSAEMTLDAFNNRAISILSFK